MQLHDDLDALKIHVFFITVVAVFVIIIIIFVNCPWYLIPKG